MSSFNAEVSGQEASDILAAALQQMDGIIARTKFENQNSSIVSTPDTLPKSRTNVHQARIVKLLDDLKLALELCDDKKRIIRQVPEDVVKFVAEWLNSGAADVRQTNGYLHESAESKAKRLETDKQSLMLQVSVLTEQVEAQADRLREMEYNMEGKRQKIRSTEEMYQSELITRSSLESHKLDLMAEVSSLKIRLATVENERRELEDRLKGLQHHVTDLEARLALKDAEAADLRQRLARNGTVVSDVNEYEVERLKKAVDALMVSNAEKDKRIDDLRKMLRRYKKIEEILAQAQGRKVLEEMLNIEDDTSSTSSTTPSVPDSSGKGENGHAHQPNEKGDRNYAISPNATSTPVNSFSEKNTLHSPPSTIASVKPTRRIQRSNSAEDITPSKNHKTPPTNKRHTDVGKRNGSYAHAEVVTDDEELHHHTGTIGTYHPETKKKRGLLRFFGKLKRSGSQDFHERERGDEFKRGGIRATATARLGWSRDARVDYDSSIPFSRWDRERIVAWLNEIGLNMYLSECRRWVKNGEHLLKASAHDIEKELSIRHPLHRKKLQLAIQDMNSGPQSKASILDHTWVMRWLDDIGLPQYKDSFFDARVDGRMLHTLTVDDLLHLKVVNELHHVSIKRGIQILRVNDYNSACLRRRPSVDEGNLYNVPGDVVLWTNHRVMEWLRTIDLSEYAPNLRGSGVHGALMVLESRFNAELFAQLLSIPNSKTLLRRHLSTHFVSLVGNEIQHKKREQEATPGNIPLVPNAKIKKGKFGIFGHKRSKSETEADSFICPLDLALPLDKLKTSALQYQNKEQDAKAAQEIGAYSKEITSLTHQLGHESFFDSVPSSNV